MGGRGWTERSEGNPGVSLVLHWRPSITPAMPNKRLHEQVGLPSFKQLWCDRAPLRGTA